MPIGPSGKATAFRASSRYLYWLKSGLTLVEEKKLYVPNKCQAFGFGKQLTLGRILSSK